jgi:hypothetical protein
MAQRWNNIKLLVLVQFQISDLKPAVQSTLDCHTFTRLCSIRCNGGDETVQLVPLFLKPNLNVNYSTV